MIVLDKHTAPFFAPESQAGAVEATFKLYDFEFEARKARDFGGFNCIVMRLKEDHARGLFVIRRSDALEIAASKRFAKQTDIWEAIQILTEQVVGRRIQRLFFFAEFSTIVQMTTYGCGQLIRLDRYEKVGAQFKLDYKTVPRELVTSKFDEFIAWDADRWFAALAQAACEPDSDLAQTLAYLDTDDEFKVRHQFGCSLAAFQRMRSLLRAALVQEAIEGSLAGLDKINWSYWMKASRALGSHRSQPLPEDLCLWKERVCAALNCHSLHTSLHEHITTTASPPRTGVQHEFNRWLTPTAIKISAPTAHELLEAKLLITEFEREYPL